MALTPQQKEEVFAVIRDLKADGLGRKAIVDVLIDDHEISMASAYRYWQEAQPKEPEPLQDNPGKIALEALIDLLRAAQARDDAEAVQSLARDIATVSSKLKLNHL